MFVFGKIFFIGIIKPIIDSANNNDDILYDAILLYKKVWKPFCDNTSPIIVFNVNLTLSKFQAMGIIITKKSWSSHLTKPKKDNQWSCGRILPLGRNFFFF